ncbi:Protein of unknown function, DUF488 [Noviherbaspirillum suwonense]|uniref:DUF488 domain-containing protein n=2 Tax=Noviherbaspirillum suwonense TaxID=1224511 RepID=A0ABY1QV74_9BURK|nr:Protein of unknown function, DUF488 [Noviherbaspirillum suwonense]
MPIFTVGYEGLDIDVFMSLLAEHNVETVVDIREIPLSRKPGFSKKSLTSALHFSGFKYVHMVNLGCPKPVRNCYREDGDWKRYKQGFLKHLKKQKAPIAELSDLAGSSNCALLCYEADFNFCHRSMVANAVRDYSGMRVEHIRAVTV